MTASHRDATCVYGALFGSEIKVTFILLRGLSLLLLFQACEKISSKKIHEVSFLQRERANVSADPDGPDQDFLVVGHVASIPLSSIDMCRSDTASC